MKTIWFLLRTCFPLGLFPVFLFLTKIKAIFSRLWDRLGIVSLFFRGLSVHSLNDPSNRALFERYISVCNEALDNNKHRFPFRQILDGLGRQALSGNSVQVLIVDDQPAEGFCIVYEKSCRVVLAEERFNSLPQKNGRSRRAILKA